MADPKLTPRHTSGAQVEEISAGSEYRLSIPRGAANRYRLAQLDDYAGLKRNGFPWRPPFRLRLAARVSHPSIPGTWGFGLWNDPFGLSLGFGGAPWRLPALPNAAWFFGASQENYLSFKTGQPQASSANGFLAQVFRSPRFHPLLIPAGIGFPFSHKSTRRTMGKIIQEDAIQLLNPPNGRPALQNDPSEWHRYRLDWHENQVVFEVDDLQVLASPVSPHAPLGLVIWIDNQYAAFTPEGKVGFGVLENPEPAWLEIKGIELA
jgi:hypothetical protein